MSKQYECLDCNAINDIAILELRDFNDPLFCRISCYKCGSIKVCRIYPNNEEKFIINGDLVAPYLDSRIVAMTEEQRKLEQVLVISGRLAIDLVDIYIETNYLVNGLTLLENHNYSFLDMSIKKLERNNQKLLNLIDAIKSINKSRET